MNPARRLGLLGGTFDPVHYGHLDAAEAARQALALDSLTFIPAHDPPHRTAMPHASAFHRFALAALAVAGMPGYRVSDLELTRGAPSYTIDTLRAFHREGWKASQIFFILGTDAFAEIATWREYPAVLDAANFVVLRRPGTPMAAAFARIPAILPRLRHDSGDLDPASTWVVPVDADTRDISSTTIRARLAAGAPIDDLVPPAVAGHIAAHHLYGAVETLHG